MTLEDHLKKVANVLIFMYVSGFLTLSFYFFRTQVSLDKVSGQLTRMENRK